MEYATGRNPVYSDHLPEDWLRLVKQDNEWLDAFQRYLDGAFRGVLDSNHDWSETLSRMESVEDACGSLDPENKTLSAYQAVSERLAMTARLDGARGFLAFHSVGSGKTVTSAACIDAFTGSGRDVYFITAEDNLPQSMELLSEIPLISWRPEMQRFRHLPEAERGEAVKKALGFRFSNQRVGKAKKATYFAQSYGVFATALNAANVREQVRQKGGSLQDFGGEGATGYFHSGDDHRPRIRRHPDARSNPKAHIDEKGHYRPLRNTVLIFDEVQNILTPVGTNQTLLYKALIEEIQREPDCKVILLTATPGDTPRQMVDVLNLLVSPPRYLHEGVRHHRKQLHLDVNRYVDSRTGGLRPGFEKTLHADMDAKSIMVSFIHANENLGVFAREVCRDRDPITGKCAPHVVQWDGRRIVGMPEVVQSHVHVHAPLSDMHKRAAMYTPGGSRRGAVVRELKNSPYTYTGHQIDINTGTSSWNAQAEKGCAAKKTRGSESKGEDITLPVCDSSKQGISEPQFLSNLRKLSTVQWGGRVYTAPRNLNSIVDVHEKVGSKIAAMLSVIRDHPKQKHVIIVSKYGGDTNKAYKTELGFALHTLFQSLGKGVMGYKWSPLVAVQESGDKVKWGVQQAEEGTMGYALYLTQMPRDVLKRVKKMYNDRRTNFGGRDPTINVMITNRVEGLSLQTTSFVHLLDAPVSTKNYFQAIGRAIRFCSAKGMEDRRVFVYEYFGTVPVPLKQAYMECVQNAEKVERALDHLREKFGGDRPVFHLTPPTVAGVPLTGFNTASKTISPAPSKSAVYHFEGFQGDLGALNGKRFVTEKGHVADAPVPSGSTDSIIYGEERSFHTGDQINAISQKCDEKHSSVLRGLPRDASGGLSHAERLRETMDQLSSSEATYRNTGKHLDIYRKTADKLGLKVCKRDSDLKGATSHERRVMAIVAALSSGDQALDKASDTFEEASVDLKSSIPAHLWEPAMKTFESSLKPINDKKTEFMNYLKEGETPFAFTGGKVQRSAAPPKKPRRRKNSSGKKCIYDESQPSPDKKKRKGLSVETDSLLTRFAGVRYGNTRRFTMAIAANAVDCLLFERFHTAKEGAMYGGLTCSGSRKESDRQLYSRQNSISGEIHHTM